MKPTKTIGMMLLSMLLLSGCNLFVPRAPLPVTAEDNTARLLKHPEFPLAARAAPNFTKEVLATITRLETEKANAGH